MVNEPARFLVSYTRSTFLRQYEGDGSPQMAVLIGDLSSIDIGIEVSDNLSLLHFRTLIRCLRAIGRMNGFGKPVQMWRLRFRISISISTSMMIG